MQIIIYPLKNKQMRDLVEMLSKLNPMAEEFVPPSVVMANGYNNNNYNLNQGFLVIFQFSV